MVADMAHDAMGDGGGFGAGWLRVGYFQGSGQDIFPGVASPGGAHGAAMSDGGRYGLSWGSCCQGSGQGIVCSFVSKNCGYAQ